MQICPYTLNFWERLSFKSCLLFASTAGWLASQPKWKSNPIAFGGGPTGPLTGCWERCRSHLHPSHLWRIVLGNWRALLEVVGSFTTPPPKVPVWREGSPQGGATFDIIHASKLPEGASQRPHFPETTFLLNLSPSLSCLLYSFTDFPSINTLLINYLHKNPCLRLCF